MELIFVMVITAQPTSDQISFIRFSVNVTRKSLIFFCKALNRPVLCVYFVNRFRSLSGTCNWSVVFSSVELRIIMSFLIQQKKPSNAVHEFMTQNLCDRYLSLHTGNRVSTFSVKFQDEASTWGPSTASTRGIIDYAHDQIFAVR